MSKWIYPMRKTDKLLQWMLNIPVSTLKCALSSNIMLYGFMLHNHSAGRLNASLIDYQALYGPGFLSLWWLGSLPCMIFILTKARKRYAEAGAFGIFLLALSGVLVSLAADEPFKVILNAFLLPQV